VRIVIAGGGPGGLFASIVLANDGHDVVLLEQAREIGDIGAGIQLSPNGTRLLAQHGLLTHLEQTAFEPQAATLRNAISGRVVFRTPLGQTARSRYGAPYLHVHRGDLTSGLLHAARSHGVDVRPGTTVKTVRTDDAYAEITTANNETIHCDLLIGADGIHSTVREQMFGATPARFTNHVAWRGVVPTDKIPEGLVAPDATVWSGSGWHFVHYYVRGGDLINFVAIKERDTWTEESWRTPGDINEVRTTFGDQTPAISALLEATRTCHLWGLFDRPPLEAWSKNRVTLLGDACHAMLPFMAQGAVMAIEDAIVLARSLRAEQSVLTALKNYEAIRKPRTTRIQGRARRNGKLFHTRSTTARTLKFLPIAAVNSVAPSLIARQLDWIYGYDALTN